MQNNTLSYLQSNEAYSNSARIIKRIEEGDATLLQKTISELKAILQSEQSPIVHILSIRLIKDIFLIGREQILRKVEGQLLPVVTNIIERTRDPSGLFMSRQEYQIADEATKKSIKMMGVQYINDCLESIKTWAQWVRFTQDGYKSIFLEKYHELELAGIQFPTDRTLYKEIDKEKFQKTYKMEFFNSQSDMQQSLINEINFQEIIQRELMQCDQVTEALRNQLKQSQSQTNWKKVKHLIERAGIFFHDQSVRLIQQLEALGKDSKQLKQLLILKQSQFGNLLQDYEFYRAGRLPYTTFYNQYGKISKFFKKDPSNPYIIEQQVHHLKESLPLASKTRNLNIEHSKPARQTIFRQQQQSRHEYTLQLEEVKQNYEIKLKTQRQEAERRVQEIKKLVNINSDEIKDQWIKRIERDNEAHNARFQELVDQARKRQSVIDELQVNLSLFQQKLKGKQQQLLQLEQAYRRTNDELQRVKKNNIQNEQIINILRVQSLKQSNGRDKFELKSQRNSQTEQNNKKMQRKIENLTQQIQLLREQLDIERKRTYREGDFEMQILKDENARLKQSIQKMQENQNAQRLKIDMLEVENLKLQQSLKIKANISQSLRKQNEWMRVTIQKPNSAVKPLEQSLPKLQNSLSLAKKVSVREYVDSTLEGDTYYQELNREFQVHFKRSCLKKKQLLYKQSNIQIGVISERKASDHQQLAVFLTNYGGRDIRDMKIRILNPASNDVSCDVSQFPQLLQGQQYRCNVDVRTLSYPIGPFVLKLNYVEDGKDCTLQLLLPITILRLVTIENRSKEMTNPSKVMIRYDKKVISNRHTLEQYFPTIRFTEDPEGALVGKMFIDHQHTQTMFSVDLTKRQDALDIDYKLEQGRQEIMRYFVRILSCLFEK